MALHYAGFIHRDICPRNFMFTDGGKNLKLIDFGLTLPARRGHAAGQSDGHARLHGPRSRSPPGDRSAARYLCLRRDGLRAMHVRVAVASWNGRHGGHDARTASRSTSANIAPKFTPNSPGPFIFASNPMWPIAADRWRSSWQIVKSVPESGMVERTEFSNFAFCRNSSGNVPSSVVGHFVTLPRYRDEDHLKRGVPLAYDLFDVCGCVSHAYFGHCPNFRLISWQSPDIIPMELPRAEPLPYGVRSRQG